jgi:chromosome segregation ATPase
LGDVDLGSGVVSGGAVQIAIDSVSLAQVRKQEAELAIKAKELEAKLREQEVKSAQKDKEQARQLEAQRAELERQRDLLELQKQQLDIDRQRFELQANRITYALKTAGEMVDLMHPGLEAATKAMIVQSLVPNLLQLANGKGLELGLPPPQVDAS